PDRVLARGYSRTVLERTGQTLTCAADARRGDLLRTVLAKGELASEVTDTSEVTATTDARRGSPPAAQDQARPDKTGRSTQRSRRKRRGDTGPTLFGE
ncbi:MAG: hypothetical protein AMK72_12765, partial [Planctomycetes bacterium SM23_25]